MANYIWRVRKDFVNQDFPLPKEAVSKTKIAIAKNEIPVVLGDYSDRPGDATWILKQLIEQKVDNILYAALRDENALEDLKNQGAKTGDSFDRHVGGFTGEQAGKPIKIKGEVLFFGPRWGYENIAAIGFGNNNVLIITPTYEQIRVPETLKFGPIEKSDLS